MVTDWSESLRRRAAVHRALGELGRLAIVDALVRGDLSPSRLQAALGMPSNLLAHHVAVLEEAGLVRRVRSEGDRRRTYLTLDPDVAVGTSSGDVVAVPRVVFVCTENAARSQLAAAFWADRSEVPAVSAGTHPGPRVHPGAIAAARRHELGLVPRKPQAVGDIVQPGDLVVTVCDRAHEDLPDGTTYAHWSVPDPVRSDTEAAFDAALDSLSARVDRLSPSVRTV